MTIRAPIITLRPTRIGAAAPVLGSSMALLTAVAAAAAPFLNIDWSDPKFAPATTWQALGSPMVLLTTGAPFAQLDWSPAKRPAPIAAPDQIHLAITQFANLTPFIPPDMSDGPYRAPDFLPAPQPYNLALLSGTVQAPFAQLIWPDTAQVPGLAPPSSQPLNLALLGLNPIPFAQYVWTPTNGIPGLPPPPPPRNGLTFSEVPFVPYNWIPVFDVVSASPGSPAPNLALVNSITTAPFAQLVWPPGFVSPSPPPAQLTRNINIFSEVPFAKLDWPSTFGVPDFAPPAPIPLNIKLFTNPIPFPAPDMSAGPWHVSRFLPPAQPYNVSLLNGPVAPTPFAKTDWPPAWRPYLLAPQQQSLNLALLNLNPIPFAQYWWPLVNAVRPPPPQAALRDILVFSEVPFFKSDWSQAIRIAGFPVLQLPNISLLLSTPFNQTDWSKPQRAPAAPLIPAAYNIALYSVTATAPFVQTDWSRSFFPRNSAPAPAPNRNFYPNPIPFVSTDRPRVVRVPLVGPPQSLPLNINLFTNPIPFNQFDWGRRFVPKLAPPQSIGSAQTLSVRFVTFLSATTVTATLSTTRVSAMMSSATGVGAATSKTKVI